jgi:hypothetical protein
MMVDAQEGGAEMSTEMERLTIELLGLPASSRALLAEQLLASLDEPKTPEVSRKWLDLAQQRAAEMASGKVRGIPAEQVLMELDQEAG